jgi:paraquat-inducible protein B
MRLQSCHCCGLIQWSPQATGDLCGRCDTHLGPWEVEHGRNRLTIAMCLTALVLYLPATTWKFLRIEQLGQLHEASLIQGVKSLLTEGHVFVGVIVLLFSIVLPLIKLSLLMFLCQDRWQLEPRHRAVTYRFVEHLGRWGMVDVLLVAVMVAFVKLGGLVNFGAGPGVILFGMFVVASLCASLAFDPHCLWAESTDSSGAGPTAVPPASPALPTAKTAPQPPNRGRWGIWMIPLVTLLVVGGIVLRGWLNQPRRIEITFQQGHGLKVRDQLRYHGIVVGEVDQVQLSDSLDQVHVHVAVTPDGEKLAREGSRFWIVRPQVDLTGIGGLDTVVGAKYLTVQPGDKNGPRVSQFRGLEEPPLPDLDSPGGIEVLIESLDAQGLSPGSGVYFRRLRIGGVISSGLNLDQSRVVARVYIRPEYRNLMRQKTVFWNLSGVRFQGGLTEFSVHVGPAETVLTGGIGVAVPPESGEPVGDGYRFLLAPKLEPEWMTWQPELGRAPVPPPAILPTLVPAQLQWEHDGLFRNSLRTRTGWLLPRNGQLVGPNDLLAVPADAITGTSSLKAGELKFDEQQLQAATAGTPLTATNLPANVDLKTRPLTVAEDAFLVTGGDLAPVFVHARLIESNGDQWQLSPNLPLTTQHHGGVLVAQKDGAVLGFVEVEGRDFHIHKID